MSQGILYVLKLSPRSSILTDLIKYYKLDIEISTDTELESFIEKFPLRKTPTFIGNDGFQLTETIAIGIYFLSMITNHDLLGDNDQEFASIIRFLSMLNQEGAMSWVGAFFRLSGRLPYNKEIIDENLITLDIIGQILDKRLANDRISGYLVGDKISYADLYGVKLFGIALYTLLGEPYLTKYPNFAKWFKRASDNEFFRGQYKDIKFPQQQLTYPGSEDWLVVSYYILMLRNFQNKITVYSELEFYIESICIIANEFSNSMAKEDN